MTAKGKINASNVRVNDRIIVKERFDADGHKTISESATKTGEGVFVARVIDKDFRAAGRYEARGKYIVHTTAGSFEAAPIQTMWLVPEDAAGIKRAHVEAIQEDVRREVEAEVKDKYHAEALDEDAERTAGDPRQWATEGTEYPYRGEATELDGGNLTLHSQDGKVDDMSSRAMHEAKALTEATKIRETAAAKRADTKTTPAQPTVENHTGSTVVALLEKVWARIRADHPELPEVVITTGSGEGVKWGHFRPESWKVRAAEGAAVSETGPGRRHELFLASEALAKGATQVLQTMLHEAAHTISRVRDVKDTSRQGRWHNAEFKKAAAEMGLEHKGSKADASHGFSFVTLTQATKDRYADLLVDLDREIRLTGLLPIWLGGSGEDEDERGGERITGKPKGEGSKSGPLKATCQCEEPVIVRLSQKVLDMGVVRCDRCEALFTAS